MMGHQKTDRKKPRKSDNTLHSLGGVINKPQNHGKLSLLQQKMTKKLGSARFRMLNESLYSTTSAKAKTLMDQSPDLFQVYHTGYAEQVKRWPKNPLDDIICYLKTQKKTLRVADLGCGEARLSREVPQPVQSFDLVAATETVTACDMANLPLPESSIDVAVFCLSLMGTNYSDFLQEAYRIIAPGGLVLVAEVASRFQDHNSQTFVNGVEAIGFRLDQNHAFLKKDSRETTSTQRGKLKKRNKKKFTEGSNLERTREAFFLKFAFLSRKGSPEDRTGPSRKKLLPKLSPCLYKKR